MGDRHLPIAPVEIPRPPVPQPPERLFLLVCNNEHPPTISWHHQTGLGGGNMQVEPTTTWRRATPDDLLAFGFAAIPPGIPELPTGDDALGLALQSVLSRMTVDGRKAVLALLQERYGDGT